MNNLYILLSCSMASGIIAGLSRFSDYAGLLIFFAYIPLIKIFNLKLNKKDILITSAVYSTASVITGLHWIGLVTLPGLFGIIILFTVYNFISFFVIRKIWSSEKGFYLRLFAFLSVMLSSELLQNFTELRFPWMNAGYSLSGFLPLIQVADLGGVYLISALIYTVNFLLSSLSKRKFIALILIFAAWLGYGFIRLNTLKIKKDDFKISMIQPSIGQGIKWEEKLRNYIVDLHSKHSLKLAKKTDLIIWTESALPYYLAKNFEMKKYMAKLSELIEAPVFLGYQDYEKRPDREGYMIFNAASMIKPSGKLHKPYFKQKLVPFGERMPFLDIFPFLWNIHLGQANFEYGYENVVFEVKDKKFAPLICFEVVFDDLTRDMFQKGIDFIVNISNDAWFYKSVGAYQHSRMAVFRATETRRPVLRCANTGFTFMVDPKGKINNSTKLYEVTERTYNLPLCEEKPFYMTKFYYYTRLWIISAIFLFLKSMTDSYGLNRRRK